MVDFGAGESALLSTETGTYSQRPMYVLIGYMQSEFGQVAGPMHVLRPLTVVFVHLHLADAKEDKAFGGVGSVNVINGAVSISVGLVLVVCQLGHIGVPHFVVALTIWPRVVPAQLHDHALAAEERPRSVTGASLFVLGMTRPHRP